MKKCKQGLAILLSIVLLVFLCPVAFAESPEIQQLEITDSSQGRDPDKKEVDSQETKDTPSEIPDLDWTQQETVSHDDMAAIMSLIPLTEKSLTADLSSYTPAQLRVMPLSTIFAEAITKGDVSLNDSVAWCRYGDDYAVNKMTDTIDLSEYSSGTFDMIVGSAKQLDKENVYYEVEITFSGSSWLTPEFFTQDSSGKRTAIPLESSHFYDSELSASVSGKYLKRGQSCYFGIKIDNKFLNTGNYDDVKVYLGDNEHRGREITSSVYNQTMTSAGAGYLADYSNEDQPITFTIVLLNSGKEVGYETFDVELYRLVGSLDFSLATTDGKYNLIRYGYIPRRDSISKKTVHISPMETLQDKYKLTFTYSRQTDKVDMAVVGNYATIEAATKAGATDIKTALFGSGYEADFRTGVEFSIFADGEVWRTEIQVVEPSSPFVIYGLSLPDGTIPVDGIETDWDESLESDGIETEISYLSYKYPATDQYRKEMGYYQNGKNSDDSVELAVVGKYATKQAAINANAKDVKDDLFLGDGYLADYSKGIIFTVFVKERTEPYYFFFQTKPDPDSYPEPEDPGSEDTYFCVTGAKDIQDENFYIMSHNHDSYYYNGFQTILLLDDTVDLTKISPTFWVHPDSKITMYAGTPPEPQESEKNTLDFSKGPVQYSASSESGTSVKNYWVTFVKKHTGGAKLFVNGINGPDGAKREVFLDSFYGNSHDIFLANVGDAQLEDLKVELTGAQNVKLHEYWTVGGEKNSTLDAFTTTELSAGQTFGELPNVAKIRLLPDGEGEIKGTLTISAKDQKPVVIELTGMAGDPQIITQTIPTGVKYVPYGTMIQTNNMHDWNRVSFSLEGGELPAGMILKPNGEIYGVPTETGRFTFEVCMENSCNDFSESYAEFTLKILENTDANVDASTDQNYEILDYVPKNMSTYQQEVFCVKGEYVEFIDLWLDGKKLSKGVDYDAESGSTKATIYAQTFENAGTGTHTLAAEFRVNGDVNKELKRAAQNYKVGKKTNTSTNNRKPSNKKPSSNNPVKTPTQPTTPTTPGTPTPNQSATTGPKLDTSSVTMVVNGRYDFLVLGNNDTANIKVEVADPRLAEVRLADEKDVRGAKYSVLAKKNGVTQIRITCNGKTSQFTVNVDVPLSKGSITLDTANYIMAPGNRYDIGITMQDANGNPLSTPQINQLIASGYLTVRDSRTGSIVDLQRLANGNFRVTGKYPGTAYIIYEIGGNHASVRIDVQDGVQQHGTSVRNTSLFHNIS